MVVCDGGWGFGQVQAHRLLDLVIPRAEALGIAAGTARNCGHIGRLGEYAERAAEHGPDPDRHREQQRRGASRGPAGGPGRPARHQPALRRRADRRRPGRARLRHERRRRGEGPDPLRRRQEARPRGVAARRRGAADDRPVRALRAAARHDPADGRRPGLQGIRPEPRARHARGRPHRRALGPPGGGACRRGTTSSSSSSTPGISRAKRPSCASRAARRSSSARPRDPRASRRSCSPATPSGTHSPRCAAEGIPIEDGHWAKLVDLARGLGVEPPAVSSERRSDGGAIQG